MQAAAGWPISAECHEFIWGERTFRFSRREAEVVRRLWEAHQLDGNPDGLDALRLLGREGESRRRGKDRVRDVFKEPGNKRHPAFGTLIIEVGDRFDRRVKRYRLNLVA